MSNGQGLQILGKREHLYFDPCLDILILTGSSELAAYVCKSNVADVKIH